MKVLFLVPYPLSASPSQRFRFEQYFAILTKRGIDWYVQSFLSFDNWTIFYSKGKIIQKTMVLLQGFAKRWLILLKVPSFDFVFIHREVTPLGPPVFEWIIAFIFKKKIIYDFDDAIWLTDKQQENIIEKLIRWRSKVNSICRWANRVSAGNDYLCSYATQFNRQVILNPTTVDTTNLHVPVLSNNNLKSVTIGWTGSHSTLTYLQGFIPVFNQLKKKYPTVSFSIIANKKPSLPIPFKFIPWSIDTEIEDLAQFDIGIMPLQDNEWVNGKCGFKALQYMALEIPVVLSPVGANTKIVQHGKNGLFASTTSEWIQSLEQLIENPELRKQIGRSGRDVVVNHYSVNSNTNNFLTLFK